MNWSFDLRTQRINNLNIYQLARVLLDLQQNSKNDRLWSYNYSRSCQLLRSKYILQKKENSTQISFAHVKKERIFADLVCVEL